jgi:predicted transcriptional regulator of viral defense system
MAREGVIESVIRGLWAVPDDPRFSALALVPFLAASNPAYVSFVSALRLHGMIDQIPHVTYVATTGRTRRISTRLGTFSFHHIDAAFFAGFDWYDRGQTFLVAEPGKALVDCLYLSCRRSGRFRHLPDLSLGDGDLEQTEAWVHRIGEPRIRTCVERRLGALIDAELSRGSTDADRG